MFLRRTLLILITLAALIPRDGRAEATRFAGNLSGAKESPPKPSPGSGLATVVYDSTLHSMEVTVLFSGLSSPVLSSNAAHLHCCTTNPWTGTSLVATPFSGFPTGVTSGSYTRHIDLTNILSYNSTFVATNGGTAATAEAALASGLAAGKAYAQVHTAGFPSGEMRSFLELALLPVPALQGTGLGLMIALLALFGLLGLRKLSRTASPRASP
jgi:hypothetical protein